MERAGACSASRRCRTASRGWRRCNRPPWARQPAAGENLQRRQGGLACHLNRPRHPIDPPRVERSLNAGSLARRSTGFSDSDCARSAPASAPSKRRSATSSSVRAVGSVGQYSWRLRTWRFGSLSPRCAAPTSGGSLRISRPPFCAPRAMSHSRALPASSGSGDTWRTSSPSARARTEIP